MGRSQPIVRVVVAFLALYGALLLYRGPTEGDQVYPVSRWDLFSRVPPRERGSYSVRFVEVDGRTLDEPVYFEKAGAFIANTSSPTAYAVLQDLGSAMEHDRPLQVSLFQERLETLHMRSIGSARYEVVKRRFDILDRFECDCFISETVLGELTLGQR